jgi:AmiR/NasT family two-component response regulator
MGLRIAEAELKASDLNAALTHRTAINMAQGIIMGQNRCSDEQAFAVLQKASSTRNEKLHEVARAVVAGVTDIAPQTYFED